MEPKTFGATAGLENTIPRSPKVGVLAFVPDTWGEGVWQLRHQILTRLSRYFHVVWMDPPRGWREAIRTLDWPRKIHRPIPVSSPGFAVYRHPRTTPKIYRPAMLARLMESLRLRDASRYLKKNGCEHLVGYLWRPEFASELLSGEFDIRCYHIDDEYSFSVDDHEVSESEADIISAVDQVFVHSPAMMEKKGHLNSNSLYVPNGVDFQSFSTPHPEPDDMVGISRPIVGYAGVLQSTIDWRLLYDVARQRGDLSFLFVGPKGHLGDDDLRNLARLQSLDNTIFLGARDVSDLPAYVQHMDICLMPYKVNGYTKYIFPLKVNEYLAAGRPTVGTPIRTLLEYSDLVILAASTDEWLAAIDLAISEASVDSARREARQEAARENDWNVLVNRISATISARLEAAVSS